MMNGTRLFAAVAALALLVAPLWAHPGAAVASVGSAAVAVSDPGQSGHDDRTLGADDNEQGITAKAAGVVTGQIAAVDYQRGVVSVLTQQHGRIDIQVLPSTNIHGRNDAFLTIGDLNRGSRVEIFLSTIGSRFVAQIIRLR